MQYCEWQIKSDRFTDFNNLGTFLVIGGRDHGKVFLCDTQTDKQTLKLLPAPSGPLGYKKKKFKPSFGNEIASGGIEYSDYS